MNRARKIRQIIKEEVQRAIVNEFEVRDSNTRGDEGSSLPKQDELLFVGAVRDALSSLAYPDVQVNYHSPQNEYEFEVPGQDPTFLSLQSTGEDEYLLRLDHSLSDEQFEITGGLDRKKLEEFIHTLIDQYL